MTGTTLSDLEQSALNALIARRGSLDDQELIDQIGHEVVDPLTVEELLSIIIEEPTNMLLRQPEFVGTVESPAELIKQNCREYLAKILELKLENVAAETSGV
jgi:hypothetical protein